MLLGVDVSSYQPVVDWQAVKHAGIAKAYCKATEGTTYADPTYYGHMNGARNAWVQPGAYHFWRPNDDPALQAAWFLRNAGWNADWLTPCLDVEVIAPGIDVAQQVDAIAVWMNAIQQVTGRPCVLYTNPSTWQGLGNPTNFLQHPLWIADYGVDAPPATVGGWGSDWAGWQYTSNGEVAGIQGGVDLTKWKA